jgi:hypothetical protein
MIKPTEPKPPIGACLPNSDGDCQHVIIEGRLRTIPFGTHIIGGRTVSAIGSSNTATTSHQKDEAIPDNPASELLEIIDECNVEAPATHYIDETRLMEKLSIYVVNRDHKILQHGIERGRSRQRELAGGSEDD